MAEMIITKSGDVLNIVYNLAADRWKEFSKNQVTGMTLALLADESAVETNMLCDHSMQYDSANIDKVGNVPTNSNQSLFNELEKML